MHGDYRKSTAQKLVLSTGHAGAVAAVVWLLWMNGLASVGMETGDVARRALLTAASIIYLLRLLATTFVFVRRRMDWSEVGVVLPWVAIIHIAYAALGGTNPNPVGVAGLSGVVLYLSGSFLNTVSEYQRMLWKQRHPGELYTRGLFQLSRHVNYFGDSMLATGFALLTGSPWSYAIPALMTALFLFEHAPRLEKYLASKYGEDFREWSSKTAMFVPYIY